MKGVGQIGVLVVMEDGYGNFTKYAHYGLD